MLHINKIVNYWYEQLFFSFKFSYSEELSNYKKTPYGGASQIFHIEDWTFIFTIYLYVARTKKIHECPPHTRPYSNLVSIHK